MTQLHHNRRSLDKFSKLWTDKDRMKCDLTSSIEPIYSGNFLRLATNKVPAYWSVSFNIVTIPYPANYTEGDQFFEEVFAKCYTDYDEVEMEYIHPYRLPYGEVHSLLVSIAEQYLDPDTQCLRCAMMVKPVSPRRVMEVYGLEALKNEEPPLITGINYTWNPEILENWNFLDRPYTNQFGVGN